MSRRAAIALLLLLSLVTSANAAVLYKSANIGSPTMGTTGLLVDSNQFIGVKFQLTSNAVTNTIGGNFRVVAGQGNEKIFGAIVTLSGPTDFPNSLDLSTPDVLGTTLLAPSNQVSGEVTAPLTLALTPGWYALIFGSDLFGATGDGRAPGQFSGDTNIDSPLYFHWNRFTNISTDIDDGNSLHNELLLTGNVVPEPSTVLIAACFAVAAFLSRRRVVVSQFGFSILHSARRLAASGGRNR